MKCRPTKQDQLRPFEPNSRSQGNRVHRFLLKRSPSSQISAPYQRQASRGQRALSNYPVRLLVLLNFHPLISSRDSKGTVLSLPPIINSQRSKITLDTKNILIECTATDKTKVELVVKTLVAMFSIYCEDKYTVEPVKIISKHNSESRITPDFTPRMMDASVSYLNSCMCSSSI